MDSSLNKRFGWSGYADERADETVMAWTVRGVVGGVVFWMLSWLKHDDHEVDRLGASGVPPLHESPGIGISCFLLGSCSHVSPCAMFPFS